MFLDNVLVGLSHVMQWQNLLAIVVGTALGIVVGALPGLTPIMGLTLLLPFTFGMAPVPSLLMLSGIFCGGIYGGGISAILIGIPDPANVPTTFDGFPMAQKGQAAKALGIAAFCSSVGGLVSAVTLLVATPILANFALRFGPPEMFAMAVFGLGIVASLAGKSLLKGMVITCFGLIVGAVGLDPVQGFARFTFGRPELIQGFEFVPMVIGAFAVPEILKYSEGSVGKVRVPHLVGRMMPTVKEWWRLLRTMGKAAFVGIVIGIAPAAGPTIAAYMSYDVCKKTSRNSKEWGTGVPEGIAASQTAINACTGGDLVLTFALGVPGSPAAALFIGALFLQGLLPGPTLFTRSPEVVYTTFVGFFVVNIIMLPLGLIASKLSASLVTAPKSVLLPFIFALAVVGSYAFGSNMFDVWTMLITGIIAYLLDKIGFGPAPFILALILGPMAEANWYRTVLMGHGDWTILLTKPIAVVLLLLAVVMVVAPIYIERRTERLARALELEGERP